MFQANLAPSWLKHLRDEFDKPYMQELSEFLKRERLSGEDIYPPEDDIFTALSLTPFENVKVVILGQDPYHGPGQAHGLSFSVTRAIKKPPSLNNIFKEVESDVGISPAEHGNLKRWAEQGVLLLNSVLTVRAGQAASHRNKGWEQFTDVIVNKLNQHRTGIVYILWGSYAQKKASFVDEGKNLVIKSVHPSPLSSYRGFFGSKPFSKANVYLRSQGSQPIGW